MADTAEANETPAWTARKLLRSARQGTLATSMDGQPFASLCTPACAPDLSVLLLLSSLSEHTRHLRAEPRCAVMVSGMPANANPQTAPRVTVTGLAEPEPDAALKARWLVVHPYATLYADFTDFALFRIRPLADLFVGGFARATRLRASDLTPDPVAVAAVSEAEGSILEHCNTNHADAMAAIGCTAGPDEAGAWRMAAVDVDGFDLALGERVQRIPWSEPIADANRVRGELIRLARIARQESAR
jgi:heme iron utilization protein